MSDSGDIHSARSPELQALLDEIAAEAARERALRNPGAAVIPESGAEPLVVPVPVVVEPPPVAAEPPAQPEPAAQAEPVAQPEPAAQAEPMAQVAQPEPTAPAAAPADFASTLQDAPSGAIALGGAAPRRPRRAMALAGGVAAAVVAIVAISVGGGSKSSPAQPDSQRLPVGYAVIASIGPDGQSTNVTVVAPMTTIGGKLVALVTGADGTTRQAPVLTVLSSAPGTIPTTSAPSTPGTTGSAATSGSADLTSPEAAGTDATKISPTGSTAPVRHSGKPTQTHAATPPPAGDGSATVVTGTSKLTGWAPVPSTAGNRNGSTVGGGASKSPPPAAGTHAAPAPGSRTSTSAATSPNSGPGAPTTSAGPSTPDSSPAQPPSADPTTDEPTTEPNSPPSSEPATSAAGTDEPTSDETPTPDPTCIAISLPPLLGTDGPLPTDIILPCP